MCVQVYVHECVLCTCVHTHARTFTLTHALMHTHVHVRTHTRTYTRMHTHMHTHARTRTHAHMHASTHTQAHTHTHTHTHFYLSISSEDNKRVIVASLNFFTHSTYIYIIIPNNTKIRIINSSAFGPSGHPWATEDPH